MRKSLLLVILVVLFSNCVACAPIAGPPAATPPSGPRLPNVAPVAHIEEVTAIRIDDDWSGLSPAAPIVAEYHLIPAKDGFMGQANFSVGGYYSKTAHVSEDLTIPMSIIAEFLQTLASSQVVVPVFRPVPTMTDNYPHLDISIITNRDVTNFFSNSQQRDYVPWLVSVNNGEQGMIDSAIPTKAYDVLRPYLKQDVQKKMIDAAMGR